MKKHTKTIWYRVPDNCEESYYPCAIAESYDITDPDDQEAIACECAMLDYYEHDGWESTWPMTFTLHATEGGPELARLRVEVEAVPQFSAQLQSSAT